MIAALTVCYLSGAGFSCVRLERHVQAARCDHAVIEWAEAARSILTVEIGAENILSIAGECRPIQTPV